MSETADVRILEFYPKYETKADGSVARVDWALIAPRGQEKNSQVPDSVPRLLRRTDGLAEYIRPRYEAWLRNEEMPEEGTPLAAWSGVNKQQIDFLKGHSLKTVEDLSAVTDAQIDRIKFPGLRSLRDQARAWNDSRSGRAVESEIAAMKEENALLKAQMAEAIAFIKGQKTEAMPDMMPKDENGNSIYERYPEEDAPRKRGRPPKSEAA